MKTDYLFNEIDKKRSFNSIKKLLFFVSLIFSVGLTFAENFWITVHRQTHDYNNMEVDITGAEFDFKGHSGKISPLLSTNKYVATSKPQSIQLRQVEEGGQKCGINNINNYSEISIYFKSPHVETKCITSQTGRVDDYGRGQLFDYYEPQCEFWGYKSMERKWEKIGENVKFGSRIMLRNLNVFRSC